VRLQTVAAGPLDALLSLPGPGDGPRPVLCFLHGYGEAAPLDIHAALTKLGPLGAGASHTAAREFILAAPQLPLAGDHWLREAESVRSLVHTLHTEHGGDPARTYLTGFSFGGNGVIDLALAQPELWAALWPVDPTRVPRRDPQKPVWLSVGHVARHATDEFARSMHLQPPAEHEPGDRVYLDQGEDHVGSARLAYADERIYAWLLRHRLG
jgi:poly(3-hydroxybutyrate) depolymerase